MELHLTYSRVVSQNLLCVREMQKFSLNEVITRLEVKNSSVYFYNIINQIDIFRIMIFKRILKLIFLFVIFVTPGGLEAPPEVPPVPPVPPGPELLGYATLPVVVWGIDPDTWLLPALSGLPVAPGVTTPLETAGASPETPFTWPPPI